MARDFGIYPENREPKLWWGARAIITQGYVDIPWDRKNFDGDKDSSELDDFFSWINNVAMPKVESCVENRKWDYGIILSFNSKDGRFHLEVDTKESGGYLYIGAWTND